MTEVEQDIIEVEGQLTRDDFATYVMWTAFGLPRVLRTMAILLALLGLLSGTMFLWERDAAVLFVCLGASLVAVILWVLLLRLFYRSAAVKQFQTYRLLQEPARYRFTPGGVSTATPSSQGSVAWTGYHTTIETKQAFYLHLGAGAAQIIPKRFFESEEQMERFRALLRRSLPPEVCKI